MGDTVNLSQWRKRQTKVADEAIAAQNRAIHGQTKFEKIKLRAEAAQSARHLQQHQIIKTPNDAT